MRGQSSERAGISWGEFCVCCVEVLELKKEYPVNGDESGADRCVCVCVCITCMYACAVLVV